MFVNGSTEFLRIAGIRNGRPGEQESEPAAVRNHFDNIRIFKCGRIANGSHKGSHIYALCFRATESLQQGFQGTCRGEGLVALHVHDQLGKGKLPGSLGNPVAAAKMMAVAHDGFPSVGGDLPEYLFTVGHDGHFPEKTGIQDGQVSLQDNCFIPEFLHQFSRKTLRCVPGRYQGYGVHINQRYNFQNNSGCFPLNSHGCCLSGKKVRGSAHR